MVPNLHSCKLFWIGVPVKIILLLVRISFTATQIAVFRFFIMCPSSHTTKSGPERVKFVVIIRF